MKKLVLAATVWCGLLAGAGQVFAAPSGSIPVYCLGTAVIAGEVVMTCYRADTRATVSPVPEGMFLHITDVVVNPNNVATSGVFALLIGRDDPDGFPGQPNLDLLGEAAGAFHFSTPYIVLNTGEDLAVAILDQSELVAIDVRASGYLATTAAP